MSTDIALIEKREEIKRRLAAGEYKTLVDICLEWFDRLIRKITRQPKPLPLWLVTLILCIVLQLISYAGIIIAGDWVGYRNVAESFGFGYEIGLLINLVNGILFIVSIITINEYIGRLVVLWRNNILEATESEESLDEFRDWLKKSSNWRLHLLVATIPNILLSPYAFSLMSTILAVPIGYGLIFSTVILNLIAWAILYQLLMVILLSEMLRRYDIKLFAVDPGSSEVISRLSGELGFLIYYVAFFAAILTLGTSILGLMSSLGIGLVILLWLPITILFILNQTGLSSIIRRAKRKTLNEIQAKVEKLRAIENFEEKETMEAINRLMDYHDRVKATRDSALDFRAYLSFFNSLLLPLIAFILGNLDLVLKLFGIKP